ncbi:opsin-VA-like [Mytilus edulis]|uniref:opsin-VA-like n=1 Tax=Mytilus edulis TaxID=6550 RepID=UPI0039EE9A85
MINSTFNTTNTAVSAVPEEIYLVLGLYLSFVCFIGVTANGLSLVVFFRFSHLRTPTNTFIIALLINDIIMCLVGIPLSAIANFQGYFVWGFSVCIFQGFVMYFGSISSMYILTAISVNRYIVIVIKRTLSQKKVKYMQSILALVFCYIFGLFWSGIPFSGWTRYEYEAIGTTCSVAFNSADYLILSYNISIFIFCYLLPVLTMIYCYINIVRMIRRTKPQLLRNQKVMKRWVTMEKRLVRTILLMICAFLISWTPYAVVAFWRAFGLGDLPVIASGIPAISSKMSSALNPFIYTFNNKEFKSALFELIPCRLKRSKRTQPDAGVDKGNNMEQGQHLLTQLIGVATIKTETI